MNDLVAGPPAHVSLGATRGYGWMDDDDATYSMHHNLVTLGPERVALGRFLGGTEKGRTQIKEQAQGSYSG